MSKKQFLKHEVMSLTPEIARDMLEKNNNNRRISPATVRKYAYDMTNGKWQLTHQAIAFDEFGNLVDGQHRLKAVITSGKTIDMLVTFYPGKRSPLGGRFDTGKIRTVSDITGIHKREVEIVKAWITTMFPSKYSLIDLDDVYEIYKEAKMSITALSQVDRKRGTYGTVGVRSAFAFAHLRGDNYIEEYTFIFSEKPINKKAKVLKAWLDENAQGRYGAQYIRLIFGATLSIIDKDNPTFPTEKEMDESIIQAREDIKILIPCINQILDK